MVPKRIQPYYNITLQTKDGENSLIEGQLTCCNANDFEIFIVGEIRNSMFSKMCVLPKNDRLVIEARCRKCGKVISVFDNSCDGYEQCGKDQYTLLSTESIDCMKCRNGGFSVGIKYEYPNIQELVELGITEIDNAFTWIWITLKCNNCGTRYKNFVDYETT